jgi:hypothetical protein
MGRGARAERQSQCQEGIPEKHFHVHAPYFYQEPRLRSAGLQVNGFDPA